MMTGPPDETTPGPPDEAPERREDAPERPDEAQELPGGPPAQRLREFIEHRFPGRRGPPEPDEEAARSEEAADQPAAGAAPADETDVGAGDGTEGSQS
jgi:hypothetical protein